MTSVGVTPQAAVEARLSPLDAAQRRSTARRYVG